VFELTAGFFTGEKPALGNGLRVATVWLLDGTYQKWYSMEKAPKRLPARFYRTLSGREPVREWLRELPEDDRKIVGEDIKDVEFSWPLGMPLVRSLGRGLWEVRTTLTQGRIARVIFSVEHGQMFLLHAFIKKTQETPQSELDLALKRMKGKER
jgi:phage-related protein